MRNALLAAFGALIFISCNRIHGSGNIVTEKREVGSFKGISTGGAYEVIVTKGATASVEVEADDNIIKYVVTEVDNGVLKIRTRDNTNFNNSHTKILVTVPEINLLKASGAASVKVQDEFKGEGKITIETSGAANIEALLDAPEISVESSGASEAKIKGRTRDYSAHAGGSANINSGELKTENTDAEASGAASVHVHASVNLKAEASGAASIYYKGGAAVQQKTSGAGNVKKED